MKMKGVSLLLVTALALLVGAMPASAGEPPAAELVVHQIDTSDYPKVNIEVSLPADMLDEQGQAEADFELLENGEDRRVMDAVQSETAAGDVNVVLLIDTSGSMRGKPLTDAQTAAHRFLSDLSPSIPVAVVAVGGDPRVITPFTVDRAAVHRGIDSLMAAGATALYDSLVAASRLLSLTPGRRVAVLLSDGGDTTSVRSLDFTIKDLKSTGSVVLAVGLQTEELNEPALQMLARETGGRNVTVTDSGELATHYASLAREFNSIFTITYTSTRPLTKDIEVDIVGKSGGRTVRTTTAFPNPKFQEVMRVRGTALTVPVSTPAYLIAAVLLFGVAVAVLALAGLLSLLGRTSSLDQLRFYEQLHGEGSASIQEHDSRGKVVSAVAAVAGKRGFTKMISQKLEKAGLPLRPAEYITVHLTAVVVTGFLVQVLGQNTLLSLLSIVLLALGPLMLLDRKGRKRTEAFEAQLPDVLNLIAGGLRTGWGLLQALDLVVNEAAAPASVEFKRVQVETRLGVPVEQSLQNVADRLESSQFTWVCVAVAIQREVGGNLAEVLDNVAKSIRDRESLQRQVDALTAEGKISAIILTVLPVVVAVGLYFMSPTYMMTALGNPLGLLMFGLAAVLLVVGLFWLRRVSRIEY